MQELLMTTATGQVSAGHGDDPMGDNTLGEAHATAVDVLQSGGAVHRFEDDMLWFSFRDDVNGGWLKTDKVDEAREVESDLLHNRGGYVSAWNLRVLGEHRSKPIRRLWIDTNKGGDVKENYRSR